MLFVCTKKLTSSKSEEEERKKIHKVLLLRLLSRAKNRIEDQATVKQANFMLFILHNVLETRLIAYGPVYVKD